MKSPLSKRPVLWFLFLFNLVVALAAPFVVEGAQGISPGIGMGVVSLRAGSALHRSRKQPQQRVADGFPVRLR